jgi:hypothetical protein
MVTLWIGDFRIKQLQTIYKAAQQTAEYHYLVEDLAEYSWFTNNVTTQLPTLALDNANIVIALGFNDCVYSCVWDSFKADQIAKKYAAVINELISDYPTFNFYVCSVNPVDNNYPFSENENGVITQKQLTEKIKLFNSNLKSACKATYIDSYTYLTDTGFYTRDGIRYTPETCGHIHNYITAHSANKANTAFLPRISAPDSEVDSYIYWTNTKDGGENPFAMPGNAAYAWGRFYEIIGELPKLSTADPEYWYSYTTDGYKRGDSPKVGAIACWQNGAPGGSDYGYVSIVEQVKDDGSIITSEMSMTGVWQLVDRVKGTGNWGMTGTYHFQGFIYCPLTVSASKEDICTKNSYNVTIDEMKPNAQYICSYLSNKGWTINAIAGLLGNLQVESKMSPASWESTINGSTSKADGTQELNMPVINSFYNERGRYPGYGLVQWTPYSKYIEWCADRDLDYWDIDSQLQRIDYEVEYGDQWISRPSKGYDLTFKSFISSTRDSAWLAEAFAFCYERPGSSTGTETEQNALRTERGNNGDFWYSYLSSLQLDVANNQLKLSSFKVDMCLATQASVSFLIQNGGTIKHSLLKNNTKVKNGIFSIKDGYKVLTFNNLIPVTNYTVKLELTDRDANTIVREISFTTQQDYPSAVKNVELDAKLKNIDSLFTLKITKPDYLGHWNATSGYNISLIVNNTIEKTVSVNNANKDITWKNFTLQDKFGYVSSPADTIQIGVKAWVKTTQGKVLYQDNLSCSSPICLLDSSSRLYLTK